MTTATLAIAVSRFGYGLIYTTDICTCPALVPLQLRQQTSMALTEIAASSTFQTQGRVTLWTGYLVRRRKKKKKKKPYPADELFNNKQSALDAAATHGLKEDPAPLPASRR